MNSFRRAVRGLPGLSAAVEASLGPWLDLFVRIWLARAFLAFLLDMMMGVAPAPASPGAAWWVAAVQAVAGSGLGTAFQAVCPLLLAIGLLTRPAALALLVQVWIVSMQGTSNDARLFWTALLLRILILGPGPISLDRLLRRGVNSVALPGAELAGRLLAWLTRRGGPAYQLALRVWLAAAPAGAALAALSVTGAMRPDVTDWLPHMPAMVASLAAWAGLLLAALLAAGAATRIAAATLLALVPLGQVAAAGDVRLPWALVLATIVVFGAGPLSLDGVFWRWIGRRPAPRDVSGLPHVVVVGGGFGGLAAVAGLARARCRITLIDQRNHHLFQPLLYQVATAGLSPSDIAAPVRGMVRDQANVRVALGQVTGVDLAGKAVIAHGERLPYDWLVLATGARHSYFGRDDWAAFAPGLKTIEDGTAIRRRLLLAFEEAENAAGEEERRGWLTFVIVGGGPTGVELAGAIAELSRYGMSEEFRQIDPATARVLLVQAGPRLLPAFPESLSHDAERALTALGVDILLDRKVEQVDGDGVTISGERVAARTVLWAAGVMASPAAAWLGVEADRAGRVPVGADLSVPGCGGVFAIGDTAVSKAWAGKEVPGLAPAAKQGGAYVAQVIRARLAGRPPPPPFRYRHFGSLATIGRKSAVADFGFVRLRGALAWWLWGAAHIAFLVGGRNRVLVVIQWVWAYLTFRRGTRLITESR